MGVEAGQNSGNSLPQHFQYKIDIEILAYFDNHLCEEVNREQKEYIKPIYLNITSKKRNYFKPKKCYHFDSPLRILFHALTVLGSSKITFESGDSLLSILNVLGLLSSDQ